MICAIHEEIITTETTTEAIQGIAMSSFSFQCLQDNGNCHCGQRKTFQRINLLY